MLQLRPNNLLYNSVLPYIRTILEERDIIRRYYSFFLLFKNSHHQNSSVKSEDKIVTKMKELKIENLNHLGIVAGIVDELEIVETINELLGQDQRELVSSGVIVKALILNGLGFVTAPLYLFKEFFQGKATEHLLGNGITAQQLTDQKIGKVLDHLWEQGLTPVFLKIAMIAQKKYQIENKINYAYRLHFIFCARKISTGANRRRSY